MGTAPRRGPATTRRSGWPGGAAGPVLSRRGVQARAGAHPATTPGRHRPDVYAAGEGRRHHRPAARGTDRAGGADPRIRGPPRGCGHVRRPARAGPPLARAREAEGTLRPDPRRDARARRMTTDVVAAPEAILSGANRPLKSREP